MNSYPRGVHVDFSKLRLNTLKRYAWYHGLRREKGDRVPELAAVCAEHFALHMHVNEHEVIKNFTDSCALGAPLFDAFDGRGTYSGAAGISAGKRDRAAAGNLSQRSYKGSKKKRLEIIQEGRKAVGLIDDAWMLVRVIKFHKRKGVYTVEDADEVSKENAKFKVDQDSIIPLPTREELATRRLMPKNSRVLARYPRTSSFYPASVVKKADKNKKNFEYSLRFDGDERTASGEIRILKVSAAEVVDLPN